MMATCPVVDISAFTQNRSEDEKKAAATDIAEKLSPNGFICLKGHGIEPDYVEKMFMQSRRFFELPTQEKMKAPHPEALSPHRGYSAPGREMSYLQNDAKHTNESLESDKGKLTEYKETFDIGSELNHEEKNIWMPEATLPGFRAFETDLYSRLQKLSLTVADAIAYSLQLTTSERETFLSLHDGRSSQLRLLHYPSVHGRDLATEGGSRLPAHKDWSSFTILFQQTIAGLQFEDRKSGKYIDVSPKDGQIALNVGDVLERLSNGNYPSSLHRVVRPPTLARENETEYAPDRYSIVFFSTVDMSTSLAAMPSIVAKDGTAKFETMSFGEYAAKKAAWHYRGYLKGEA